jgi:hypothetical protein
VANGKRLHSKKKKNDSSPPPPPFMAASPGPRRRGDVEAAATPPPPPAPPRGAAASPQQRGMPAGPPRGGRGWRAGVVACVVVACVGSLGEEKRERRGEGRGQAARAPPTIRFFDLVFSSQPPSTTPASWTCPGKRRGQRERREHVPVCDSRARRPPPPSLSQPRPRRDRRARVRRPPPPPLRRALARHPRVRHRVRRHVRIVPGRRVRRRAGGGGGGQVRRRP